MDEKWESPHTGAESHDESPRACTGELACRKESSGFSGSGEPGGAQADRREAEDTGYIKESVEKRENGQLYL